MSRFKLIGAALLVLAGLGLAWHGMPSAEERVARQSAKLESSLAKEEARIDPGELYDLMKNTEISLVLFDVRPEVDYNIFHLRDARRLSLAELGSAPDLKLAPAAIVVVMSNDEPGAEQAWKLLTAQGVLNVYYLGGGLNFWLDVYRDGKLDAPLPPRGTGADRLRHQFTSALGAAQPAAYPDPLHPVARKFTAKVKSAAAANKPRGGCG